MELNNIQNLAVSMAERNDFIFSITGSAGTGKSATIKAIVEAIGKDVVVLAPTGRAAKLLESKIGQGTTIHKFLEYYTKDNGKTYKPRLNANNQFVRPVYVIIDEASMVTREVFDNLLKALPDGSRLCLVGDPNQLPPIENNGHESVFKTCIKKYPTIELCIRYRFGKQLDLSLLSDEILRGNSAAIIKSNMAYRLDGATDDIVINRLASNSTFYDMDSQIISPTYKGKTGCDWINKMCQFHRFDGNGTKINEDLYVGDKIITTMNTNYFMNGDVGYIHNITDDMIFMELNGCPLSIPRYIRIFDKPYDLTNCIKLAYCITTHKSQGGEYENVAYVIGKSSMPVLNRANIYTGVTRSKKNLWIFYDKWTVEKGIKNVNV